MVFSFCILSCTENTYDQNTTTEKLIPKQTLDSKAYEQKISEEKTKLIAEVDSFSIILKNTESAFKKGVPVDIINKEFAIKIKKQKWKLNDLRLKLKGVYTDVDKERYYREFQEITYDKWLAIDSLFKELKTKGLSLDGINREDFPE